MKLLALYLSASLTLATLLLLAKRLGFRLRIK